MAHFLYTSGASTTFFKDDPPKNDRFIIFLVIFWNFANFGKNDEFLYGGLKMAGENFI